MLNTIYKILKNTTFFFLLLFIISFILMQTDLLKENKFEKINANKFLKEVKTEPFLSKFIGDLYRRTINNETYARTYNYNKYKAKECLEKDKITKEELGKCIESYNYMNIDLKTAMKRNKLIISGV